MKTTKDEILMASVKLFAERGYDAVSTSMIASELGITKGALYRHFENKQEIFDSIIQKMFELDEEMAEDAEEELDLTSDPEEEAVEMADLCEFVEKQFEFWTEDEFGAAFRRMITLEQFRGPEMNKLYQDLIGEGPVGYTEELIQQMMDAGSLKAEADALGAWNLAMQIYAPMLLMIHMVDGGADRAVLKERLQELNTDFVRRWSK